MHKTYQSNTACLAHRIVSVVLGRMHQADFRLRRVLIAAVTVVVVVAAAGFRLRCREVIGRPKVYLTSPYLRIITR